MSHTFPTPALTMFKCYVFEASKLHSNSRRDRSVISTLLYLRRSSLSYPLVTSLESVVLQLQDSCREARSESGDLRQDNARLRHELREREKFWRALWQARKTGQAPESDDLPPLPSSFAAHPQPTNINNRTPSSHGHYSDDSMGYQTGDETSNSLCSSSYTSAPSHSYATQSPALSYTGVETEQITSGGTGHHMNARVSRYGSYPYPMQPINRDGPWTHNVAQTTSANG